MNRQGIDTFLQVFNFVLVQDYLTVFREVHKPPVAVNFLPIQIDMISLIGKNVDALEILFQIGISEGEGASHGDELTFSPVGFVLEKEVTACFDVQYPL